MLAAHHVLRIVLPGVRTLVRHNPPDVLLRSRVRASRSACPASRETLFSCNATADTVCSGCKICKADQYEAAKCSSSADTTCATCSGCDVKTQFLISACDVSELGHRLWEPVYLYPCRVYLYPLNAHNLLLWRARVRCANAHL